MLMKKNLIFYFLFFSSFFFFIFTSYKNLKPFLKQLKIFPIKKIQLIGFEQMDSAYILNKMNIFEGSSLVFIDEKRIRNDIENQTRLEVIKIKKKYPDTLRITFCEKEGNFIIKDGEKLKEINDWGQVITEEEGILNFDKFYIEYDSNLTTESIKKKLVNDFLAAYRALPKEEKDIINISSGICLGKDNTLFLKENHLESILGYSFNVESLRKARYAYLYQKINKMKVKKIDLRYDFVKFTLIN